MSAGPVIGIAGASYTVVRPFGELGVHGIPRSYVEHVCVAGGRPVIIPPRHGNEILDVLDGLVLAGGGDLDPRLYGADGARVLDVDRDRDAAEITLARQAREAGLPVLGICRGAQLLTVADGGTLVPDLGPDRPHVLVPGSHRITTLAGSVCAGLLGRRPEVNSLHHQAIDRTGAGWHVTARADDGVVEAVEWSNVRDWAAVGVQWHPELDHTGAVLFRWLVGKARSRVAGGTSYDLVP